MKTEGRENANIFPEERLQEFCSLAFETFGLPREDDELFADTLVKAEIRGVSSHGIIRLPFYWAILK